MWQLLKPQFWKQRLIGQYTAFNFMIPLSSPLSLNTRITSLGRPLKLSSIPTIWTERWVFVSASHGSRSFAPSRNLMPDLQGIQGSAGPCTLNSLAPRPLGQCPLGSPSLFSPDTLLHRLWPATYSPISNDAFLPLSSLLISHVAHALSLPVLI
jgi:hypothetical protein